MLALSQKAAFEDLSVVVGARLARDEKQVSELNPLREQEGRVVVGLGDDTLQHGANSFTYGWSEGSKPVADPCLYFRNAPTL
ncbi:hypothetical protein D3C72_2334330 [compost metagenome]